MGSSEYSSTGWPARLVAISVIVAAAGGVALLSGVRLPTDLVGRDAPAPIAERTTGVGTPADVAVRMTDEELAARRAEEEQQARLRELRADHDPLDQYITFLTPYAEETVRLYAIACPQPGKSVRLMDLMRSGTRFAVNNGARMYTSVDSRGQEVRISQDVQKNGVSTGPKLVASINEWGEFRLHGISRDAVMLECYR